MNWKEIPITDLIPQRSLMVMVDCVMRMDGDLCVTQFKVTSDCLFLDGSLLSSSGLIENMAQSCAARMGALNVERHEAIKIGFIGDIRGVEILGHPKVDDTLTTVVSIVVDVFNLTLADVEVKVGDKVMTRARMKIASIETNNKQL